MTRKKKPEERVPGRKIQKPYKRNQPQNDSVCSKCTGVNGSHFLTCPTLRLPKKPPEEKK